MQLKPIQLSSSLAVLGLGLAPMAGFTSSVFRQICRRYGAGFVVSELVSARGLVYDPGMKRSYKLLCFEPSEEPVFLQLFGSEASDFARATEIILSDKRLGHCAGIDINMGCPVPKVVSGGSGSALLNNIAEARAIVAATVSVASRYGKPVTVKSRLGYRKDERDTVLTLAQAVEAAGATMLTIHGRTRDEFYSGTATWLEIEKVAQIVTIPVLGNGDIRSLADFKQRTESSLLSGVAIGRGALGNPWLFKSILQGEEVRPSQSEWQEVLLEHVAGMISQRGEYHGVREMRKQASPYLSGVSEAAKWRRLFLAAETYAEYEKLVREVKYEH